MSSVFFTDRDLGKQFPAILREAGILVERHVDHFADDAPDERWIAEVARRGWYAVTHGKRIRYKVNEREAVLRNRLGMFVVIGKRAMPLLARNFVNTIGPVEAFIAGHRVPFIAKVYSASDAELGKNAAAPGRVAPWVPHRPA